MTNPMCIHGKAVHERCLPCEEGLKRGEHGGFVRADSPPSKELDALIRRVNALIPSSVTPATRIEIHPCDWLALVDEVRTAHEPPAEPVPADRPQPPTVSMGNIVYRSPSGKVWSVHPGDPSALAWEPYYRDLARWWEARASQPPSASPWKTFAQEIPVQGKYIWWSPDGYKAALNRAADFCDKDKGVWCYAVEPPGRPDPTKEVKP